MVEIGILGEAYYSGQTVEEYIIIKDELYNKITSKLGDDFFVRNEIYLGELDGKHSCVYGNYAVEKHCADCYIDTKHLMDKRDIGYFDRLEESLREDGLDIKTYNIHNI